ncbi:hypothetical protein DLM_3493 [Aquitalea magnusonii]|uniref:DUF3304 domain-containing protein n=1 Tax=Aquitalea magnusonii TaxID=332411 RepID=A0A3G9GM17_9NEIS|nr:DUF3304 domain-containing protein [Aquitalea magnusonii]BBF87081.1 hypothetical protein DLM_3493 [Aquitalea magnusonii]
MSQHTVNPHSTIQPRPPPPRRRRRLLASCLLALLTACAGSSSSFSLIGAPVRVYDLTGQRGTILDAGFDFIGRTGAPGEGGEVCCASLPKKWYPGMIATVRWVKDPDASLLYPTGQKAFTAYMKRKEATYQRLSAQVELLPYIRTCGVTLVFLPCDQVRVTIDCDQEGPLISQWRQQAAAMKGKSCPNTP